MASLVPVENVQSRILLIRGHRVVLDSDLARLYGGTTKRLNEQVKRNKARFPADFMIRLTPQEKSEVVAHCDHLKNLRFSPALPHAFTEHGALMVSSVLNTPTATEVGLFIVRAFVTLRDYLADHQEIAYRVMLIEEQTGQHASQIQSLWNAMEELKKPPEETFPKIEGFKKEG